MLTKWLDLYHQKLNRMSSIFSEDTNKSGRPVTIGIFAALVVFFFFASKVVPMPSREQVDRSLDLIILEAIAAAEAPEAEEETEDPAEESDASESETTLEDFEGLLAEFSEFLPSEALSEESTMPDRNPTSSLILESEVGLDFGSEEVLDLFGETRPGDLNADLNTQSRGATWTLQPNLIAGSTSGSTGRLSSGTGGSGVDLTTRPDRPERLVESITGERDDVSLSSEEIFRENAVVRWMQERINELDRPVRTLFEQQARDLTVNEPVIIGGKTYYLQMMYSPVTRTLHIAWVDGDDLFYFIDPALQFRVNYFEEGIVERASGTEIVLLETEELSAQSPTAVRQYQKFLSWWRPQIEENEN